MLASAAASSSPVALWFLTRGTGVVTLLLFTVTVILGIANRERLQTKRIPRFVVDGVHRNASLLAVVFLCVHIGTTLADSYVPITIANVLIPFSSSYKPFWVGLGAIAFDLLMAVALTSALAGRRTPVVAGRALARLCGVAGRARARRRHGQRPALAVDARADRWLRARGRHRPPHAAARTPRRSAQATYGRHPVMSEAKEKNRCHRPDMTTRARVRARVESKTAANGTAGC